MLSEWMHRLKEWLVVPIKIPLVVVGMESRCHRIRLEPWRGPLAYFGSLLLYSKQREPSHENRPRGHYSDPLVVLLLSSDGGVKPEAMLTQDLILSSDKLVTANAKGRSAL